MLSSQKVCPFIPASPLPSCVFAWLLGHCEPELYICKCVSVFLGCCRGVVVGYAGFSLHFHFARCHWCGCCFSHLWRFRSRPMSLVQPGLAPVCAMERASGAMERPAQVASMRAEFEILKEGHGRRARASGRAEAHWLGLVLDLGTEKERKYGVYQMQSRSLVVKPLDLSPTGSPRWICSLATYMASSPSQQSAPSLLRRV